MYLLVFPSPSPQATICPGHRSPEVPQPTGVRGKSQASLQNTACLSPVCTPASAPSMAAPQTSLTLAADSSTALKSHLLAPLLVETNFLKLSPSTACPQHRPAQLPTQCPDSLNTDSPKGKGMFFFLIIFFQFLFWSIFFKNILSLWKGKGPMNIVDFSPKFATQG